MWHEARRQERLIRGLIVDYRRRAERRKDFYEKIKAEPTQFLQLHGRVCKIHLDPAVAAAGEGPAIMMPWQGDTSNMIDRFDVRAHLDYIPDIKVPDIPPDELSQEERQCNYERYRILAQNTFLGISEDKFLKQLALEEQFGITIEEREMQKERLNEKKGTGVAIGYNYNDPGSQPSCSNGPELTESKDSDDESDLEIIDVDLSIDVNKMKAAQAHELNAVGPQYGMTGCDLFSFLTGDADEAEHQKQLLREEKEKALFSGRKSRRERRAHRFGYTRDKRLPPLPTSPPSYAAPAEKSKEASPARSNTRSPSPEVENIEFITSFGPDEEDKPPPTPKPLYSEKLKKNLKKNMLYSEIVRKRRSRSRSRDKPRPVMGPRFRDSISRSRSKSYSRSRSRSKSRSTSRSRSRSRSNSSYRRSRSRSYGRRSRSRSNYGGNGKRNRSRSMSYESKCEPKAVPRYYGRRKEDKSSSELSLDSDSSTSDHNYKSSVGNKSQANQNQLRLTGSSSKGTSREALTMKERLKRKMQAQLSRQLRADKRLEAERLERESRRQARRDEEMRELAIKLRRKQREMRHQQSRRSSEDDSERSRSESSPRKSPSPKERSKSKSKTPEKRIQVWESDEVSPYKQKYQEVDRRRHEEEFRQRRDNRGRKDYRGQRHEDGPSRRDDSDGRKVKLVDY
ncbi:CLK4-associating serine/arginine rich protein isoform X2 [Pieris napi]|uniref:CLK4-associating serine/arginine rich protein isoform X2 n=1 Tax=Pieris napi TaxID=78633 RepID=UPI001FBBABF1|nr:CLK4-associating serine/arginine rich protein isoform X2 [Pieris napi]